MVSNPKHELDGCGGECAVDRCWQRVTRMNDNKERLNENPGWLMTKRISTKILLCCDAHEWKQTLCNNLYELSHQPQQEWWNAERQWLWQSHMHMFLMGQVPEMTKRCSSVTNRRYSSSSWMPLCGSMKMISLPRVIWLPRPRRCSPFPDFLNLVFSDLWFFRWRSTIILEGHFTESHKYGIMPRQICLVLSRSPCFGIPELVQIGECRNLEAHFQDNQQSSEVGRFLFAVSFSKISNPSG